MASQLPIADPAPADGLLPQQSIDGAEQRSLHAYLHIPFCRVRCGYCDFNTYTASELDGVSQASFADVLISEIEFSRAALEASGVQARKFSTVFFGGGTPTQLPAADLVRIFDSLRRNFGITNDCEVTTEANPDNVNEDYLRELREGGFTRISFGMQSTVLSVLKTLEREHNPANVSSSVAAAKRVGLSTSVDLIYGAPNETYEQWRASVEAAIELDPDHISAYSLIVEEGTKLARQIAKGELPEPDEELQADKYELADDLFGEAGYHWYEVSNWAKSSKQQSRHNLAYWQSNDWWGYGPGAHSHIGGVRWWNVKHPAPYAEKLRSGISPALGRETLDERTRLEERILLEIRISDGLEISVIKQLSAEAAKLIPGFISDGLIDGSAAIAGKVILTLRGRLLADSLVRQFLA